MDTQTYYQIKLERFIANVTEPMIESAKNPTKGGIRIGYGFASDSRWIECKPGQMPEDFEDYDPEKEVIVYNATRARLESRVRCYSIYHSNKYYWANEDNITHWQPLPDTPTKEGGEL